MNATTIRVAIAQIDCAVKDKSQNLATATDCLDMAGGKADIVCFPELFTTGYNLDLIGNDHHRLAETIPGPTTSLLADKVRASGLTVVGNIIEQDPDRETVLYDTTFVLGGDGTLLGRYRKHYLFPPEYAYFSPGSDFDVVETGGAVLGMAICFDHAFPELFRLLGLKGAQIVFIPSAVPEGYEYLLNLRTRARAQDNQYFVVAANRIGTDGDVRYCGLSKIVGPRGEVIAEASQTKQELIYGEIDLAEISAERTQEPVLRSLRPEIYREIAGLV